MSCGLLRCSGCFVLKCPRTNEVEYGKTRQRANCVETERKHDLLADDAVAEWKLEVMHEYTSMEIIVVYWCITRCSGLKKAN